MTHTTEVVEYKKLSNGQFQVTLRCCGNASTDWTHTMAAEVASDPEKRKASIDAARGMCAELHDHAVKGESGLIDEMGSKVEHQ